MCVCVYANVWIYSYGGDGLVAKLYPYTYIHISQTRSTYTCGFNFCKLLKRIWWKHKAVQAIPTQISIFFHLSTVHHLLAFSKSHKVHFLLCLHCCSFCLMPWYLLTIAERTVYSLDFMYRIFVLFLSLAIRKSIHS